VGSVAVEYTKWGGARHWHFAVHELGIDDHGTWFSAPPGTVTQRGDEPPTVEANGFVMLVPDGPDVEVRDWIAFWYRGGRVAIYVDVTDTPRYDGRVVSATDLDLDVVATRDGGVEIVDVDEFDEHRVVLGYPPEVVGNALSTADWLFDRIRAEVSPFDASGWTWLERATKDWPS
jgi:uncharacterized protein